MRVDLPVLVREATAADAESIGEVHAEAFRVAHRDLFDGDWLRELVERRRTMWVHRMSGREHARNTLLVAERGRDVAAFVYFGPHSDGTSDGEIFDCFAHPDVWGRRVAATVMDKAWELLREARFRRVRLWTMAGANRARHFYESFGFTETGQRRERDFGDGRPVLEVEYVRRTR
ncbi:MAG TPA: GNAT family N-acetyltransferase [Actinophytocola sp.]|jgi:ribosomal protein S18 acetylase RimI-like enzyme|uniref:GNAT family N-acetyltransferase n=1 Tax=Actinophytocola sp. TaxID=1872138 RepID=UPI002F95C33D